MGIRSPGIYTRSSQSLGGLAIKLVVCLLQHIDQSLTFLVIVFQEIILDRIKYQLGYPEAARDMLPKSVLTAVHLYSMGKTRSLKTYMGMIGMNVTTKEATEMEWCTEGQPPPGFEEFAPLYKSN